MRLLLIEDDRSLGKSLKKVLEKQSYGIDWMLDGESALEALKDSPYAAAILDINLPKLTGLEILKTIRHRKNRRVR